jgi:hypothetical protein
MGVRVRQNPSVATDKNLSIMKSYNMITNNLDKYTSTIFISELIKFMVKGLVPSKTFYT